MSTLRATASIGAAAAIGMLLTGACQYSDPTGPHAPGGPQAPDPTASPIARPMMGQPEGYPEPGDTATGWIMGPGGRPIEVVYEIHEGLAIWQGDIIVGRAGQVAASRAQLEAASGGLARLVAIDPDGGNNRWPGGVVPYTINAANPPTQSIVDAAIDWVEDQTPGVTFVLRTGESDYVTFQNSTGCSSEIGRIGGQQFINLKVDDGTSRCTVGNAAHEILHALGFYHEHTRCDRDSFVSIDYTQVESGREGNFYKAGSGTEAGACSGAFDIGAYDFGSIMHYGLTAFAIGSAQTITPIAPVPAGVTVGQRDGLSATDAASVDALYGPNNAAPTVNLAPLAASYPEGTPVPYDASGSTDADDDDDLLIFSWIFGDGTCPGPAACSSASPSHAYADNGTYGYSVSVSDGFDAAAFGTTIDITNVAPTVDAGAATASVDEGSLFTRAGTFTDPGADTWTATVDYGEGAGPTALALVGKSFSLSHSYPDGPALFGVAVRVEDDDAGVGTDGINVTVNNVAPLVEAGPTATLTSGETFNFSGSFTDPGLSDNPWTWVITWNDGRTPATTSGSLSTQALITASRQVCAAGDYTVTLEVTDKDAGKGSDGVLVQVGYVGVEIVISPGKGPLDPVNLAKGGNLPVAILSSATFDATTLDPSTLTLGDELGSDTHAEMRNNGSYQTSIQDVNGDGLMDLVVKFRVQDLVANGDLVVTSTALVLRGFQSDGCLNVRGTSSIVIRP